EAGSQSKLKEDSWSFGNWIDAIPGGDRRQFRHMILFLLFPDSYERISSSQNKKTIVATFRDLPGVGQESIPVNGTDSPGVALDKKLLGIRRVFEKKYPGDIDF